MHKYKILIMMAALGLLFWLHGVAFAGSNYCQYAEDTMQCLQLESIKEKLDQTIESQSKDLEAKQTIIRLMEEQNELLKDLNETLKEVKKKMGIF